MQQGHSRHSLRHPASRCQEKAQSKGAQLGGAPWSGAADAACAQAADDAEEEEDEFADDEEEGDESAEEDLKHDPKRLATLAKRGMQLDLKEGVTVAKGKKPAAAKGKAAGGAAKGAAKGKAKKA